MKTYIERVIAVFLVAIMLLSAAPLSGLTEFDLLNTTVGAESATTVDYKLYEGYLTFKGTGAMVNYNSGKPSPFSGDSNIVSAYIPQGVTSIGQSTFVNCPNLKRMTIPSSVTKIEANAFSGTTAIADICYYGTTEGWNKIVIENGNSGLQNTRITCTKDAEWENGLNEGTWIHTYPDFSIMYPAVPSSCSHHGWSYPYEFRPSCQGDIEIEGYCPECKQKVIMISPQVPHCLGSYYWNHDYDFLEATCFHEIQYYRGCRFCNLSGYFTRPPIDHYWCNSDWHEATCTQDGYEEYTCEMCGETCRDNIIPATGHNYQWYSDYPESCTHDSFMQYRCSHCGDVVEEKTIPATGHSFGEWKVTKEATITSTGLKERKCSKCGYAEQIVIEMIQPKIYKVTFDNKGADTAGTSALWYKYNTLISGYFYYSDSACTMLITDTKIACPKKAGYQFGGYFSAENGNGTQYIAADGTYLNNIYKTAGSKTLYAKWTPVTYKVTLDNKGANTAGTTAFWYKYNTVINGAYYYTNSSCTTVLSNYKITVPTKKDYVFGGYYTGENGTGTQYINASGVCVNSIFKTIGSKTLYAKWTYNHTHSYTSSITKPATCTEDGVRTYKCSCGNTYTETIEHTDHSYVRHVVEPTCTEDGYLYYTCNNCDGHFSTSNVTPATGHSFGEWKVTKEATTTSTGLKERKCSKCGYVEKIIIEKIQPKIYKVTFDNKGADTAGTSALWYKYNTISGGKFYYSDSACTKLVTDTKIACPKKSGYQFGGYFSAENGNGTQYIAADGTYLNDIYKTAGSKTLYAKWTPVTYKVTLDNKGANTAGTTAFWYKYNTVINGAYYYTNSSCTTVLSNYKITVPTKKDYVFGGYYTGENGTGTQYINANGICVNSIFKTIGSKTLYAKWTYNHTHSYTSSVTKPATCTEDGVRTYKCSCGNTYTEAIKHTDHSYVRHVVEPTCTEDGYLYYTCNNCDGHFSTSNVTPATGHSFGEWKVTKEATTTSTGLKERKCSKCGYSEKTTIPQLIPVSKVTLNNHDVSLDYKESAKLIASTNNVEWYSSNPSVISVDQNGNIKAVGVGTAEITVKDLNSNTTDTCKVTSSLAWWQWIIKIVLFGWIWY